ncbi:MAG TPA: PadR family transcriptional regulator [Thermoanaerobaculia bacterium]|nr:PadR family transcriptional regulator [Thermoanaerobaculia bacterium]
MPNEPSLTEMDYTILGIIGRQGPLSAYDIRKVFAASLTPTWSSSTGSVYPSSRRLLAAKLISESAPEGARSRKRLRITPKGRNALTEWLTDVHAAVASPTPDPIRTRMYFLAVLDEEQRNGLVAAALARTDEAIAISRQRLRDRSHEGRDDWELWAAEGVLYELEARREWLTWFTRRMRRR